MIARFPNFGCHEARSYFTRLASRGLADMLDDLLIAVV